ncbi:unnamed protein product, partial [Mesorhabditis spiculigera]
MQQIAVGDEFDKTQWENTEWKEDHRKWVAGEKSKSKSLPLEAPPEAAAAGDVPGEVFQQQRDRGAYLKDTPWISFAFFFVEASLIAGWVSVASALDCAPDHSVALSAFNAIVMFISIMLLFGLMVTRTHVEERQTDGRSLYLIPYAWKLLFFALQWLRVCLAVALIVQHALVWSNPTRLTVVIVLASVQFLLTVLQTLYSFNKRFTLADCRD